MAGSTGNDEHRTHKPAADAMTRRAPLEQRADAATNAESVDALSALGQRLIARREFTEAESVLTRALALTDNTGSTHEVERQLLLNDLSRIHLRQHNYAAAEPVLLRLLAIKQEHGDERPEVATVLASLATVRKARGDHSAAEGLYRHALRIREKTLPPNHITTAATLESLGDACAARGHFAEAIVLLRSALAMREVTLGHDDPSVLTAREHIADLELQVPEETGAPPQTRPPVAAPLRPTVTELLSPTVTARRTQPDAPPPVHLAPWARELVAVQHEIGADPQVAVSPRVSLRNAQATRTEQRSSRNAAVATIAAIALLAVLGLRWQRSRVTEESTYVGSAGVRARTEAQRPPVLPGVLSGAVTPASSIPEIESSKNIADSFPNRLSAGPGSSEGARSENQPTPPKLVGAAPRPLYPHLLKDLRPEGEVLVQFVVDANGRPDPASLRVLHSPHELLTNAVRAVLPQFRFEPARSAAPEAKPRAEIVKYGFAFRAPAR